MVFQKGPSVHCQNVVRSASVHYGAKQFLQSSHVRPKENFPVDQSIPLAGLQIVQEFSKLVLRHGSLIPNHSKPISRMSDCFALRSPLGFQLDSLTSWNLKQIQQRSSAK